MRPLQLEPLDVDRHTGKQAVAAAVVEVKVGVDDAHDVSGMFSGIGTGAPSSSSSGVESIMPVSTRTTPSACSIVCT
jgi:hypothetical protein